MILNYEGKTYAIRWQYDQTINPPYTLHKNGRRIPNEPPFHRNRTTCFIEERHEEGVDNTIVSQATVSRKWDDAEDKEYARKESLKKALDLRGKLTEPTLGMVELEALSTKAKYDYLNPHFFSKEFRAAVWEVYHDRKPIVQVYKQKFYVIRVTQEDLDRNPHLLELDVNIGDKVLVPILENEQTDLKDE